MVATVVAAVALTVLAAVFIGAAALVVAGVAVISIAVLALTFRAKVVAYETYYLHNPHAPRVAFRFDPPPQIGGWYRTHRPQIIRVQPARVPFQGVPVRPNQGQADLTGFRQRPGSSSIPTYSTRPNTLIPFGDDSRRGTRRRY